MVSLLMQEWFTEIEWENKILLKKMTEIMENTGSHHAPFEL